MIAGGTDHKVRFWRRDDMQQHRIVGGHDRTIYASAIDHDGKRAATGGAGGRIVLWDLATGRATCSIRAGGRVNALAFDRHGEVLYSAGTDGVRLWDAATGRACGRLADQRTGVWDMDLDHARELLAVADGRGVHVYDLTGKRPPRTMRSSKGSVQCVTLHRTHNLVIGGTKNGLLCTWDGASGALLQSRKAHEGAVFDVAIDPTGKLCASGGADKQACLWRIRAGRRTRSL